MKLVIESKRMFLLLTSQKPMTNLVNLDDGDFMFLASIVLCMGGCNTLEKSHVVHKT